MFQHAIVRKPAISMINGITSAPELGRPDYELALRQHDEYIAALRSCGVEVMILEALEEYPDSCFVEDVAVCTRYCAIITNPGASSRNLERGFIVPALGKYYSKELIHTIEAPGTLEGGDVMIVGEHFYIGLSARTNIEGANQLIDHLGRYGLTAEVVPLSKGLHLKTGLSFLGKNNLLIGGESNTNPVFGKFNKFAVPEAEAYACNCLWMNDKVIVPSGYPITEKAIMDLGYQSIVVDTSEYRKLDGGLTCLSLRF